MSRVNRYVFREILGPSLLGLLVYGLVLLMNLMLSAAELFIRRDLPMSLVAQYIVLSLPRILVLVIPMAVLVGVLVGIGRMTADSEITALRAAGRADRSLLRPVLGLGLLGALICGVLFNVAVPAANYAQHQMNARIFLSSDLNREIQARVFYERIPEILLYADSVTPEDGTLGRVLLCQKSPAGFEEVSTASRVSMDQKGLDGTIQFRMENVVSHAWNPAEPGRYQIIRSASQVIERPPDLVVREMIRALTAPPPRNLREQTVPQLLATLDSLDRFPASSGRQRETDETLVELHKKFSLPATSLAFSILALPLALGRRRQGGRAWGFVVSIAVIVLSYVFLIGGEKLADRGVISPAAAMWGGNVFFAGVGLVMLLTGAFPDLRLGRGRRRDHRLVREGGAGREAADPVADGPDRSLAVSLPENAKGLGSPGALPKRAFFLLDRYLLSHLVGSTCVVALSLTALFTIFYAVNLVDDLLQGGQSASLFFSYLLYLQPQLLFTYVLPISLCLGTLITFGLLARTHELLAIRAGGISLMRVALPFLLAGTALAGLSFVAHDSLLPYTNQRANQLRDQVRNRSPRSYRQPARRWVFGSQGALFNFSDFNRKKSEFQDLTVFEFAEENHEISRRLYAAKARWQDGGWVLLDGWSRTFSGGRESFSAFTTQALESLDPPDYFVQDWKAPDQMSFSELRAHVIDLEHRGYDVRDLRVGLHRKTAIPAVCLILVMVGLPFALRVERRGAVFALGVGILIVFLYFVVLQSFGKMGEVAALPPLIAAWAPNLLFGSAGIWFTATARW